MESLAVCPLLHVARFDVGGAAETARTKVAMEKNILDSITAKRRDAVRRKANKIGPLGEPERSGRDEGGMLNPSA